MALPMALSIAICWHVQSVEFSTETFLRASTAKGDISFLTPGVAHGLPDEIISELTVKLPWALTDEL